MATRYRIVVLAAALLSVAGAAHEARAQEPSVLDLPASSAASQPAPLDEPAEDAGEPAQSPLTLPRAIESAEAAAREFRDCDICPEMVQLPSGSFTIGSDANEPGRDEDEGPQQRINIAGLAVGKFEVTFDEWDACAVEGGCTSNPSPGDADWGRGRRPVINVSWDDANEYVRWLSARTGHTYRLLSEAEWEYAARAGSKAPFPWGHDPSAACKFANLRDMSVRRSVEVRCRDGVNLQTASVGGYRANAFGLYDMQGNVWEWVQDCYAPNYEGLSESGAARNPRQCALRVERGGSWDYDPEDLRSANRDWFTATSRISMLGFRVARSVD